MIANCDCKNKFQDECNGEGKRVFNKTKKMSGTNSVYRCTVCGKEKPFK